MFDAVGRLIHEGVILVRPEAETDAAAGGGGDAVAVEMKP